MLLVAILRGAIGLAIVGVAIVGLVFSFMSEGIGCAGSIICFVFFIALGIAESTVGDDAVEAFLGVDVGDYFAIVLIAMVGGFLLSGTHIAGIGTSFVVGYTGVLITGFLDAADIAVLSDAAMGAGVLVMLPIALPCVVVIVGLSLLLRG